MARIEVARRAPLSSSLLPVTTTTREAAAAETTPNSQGFRRRKENRQGSSPASHSSSFHSHRITAGNPNNTNTIMASKSSSFSSSSSLPFSSKQRRRSSFSSFSPSLFHRLSVVLTTPPRRVLLRHVFSSGADRRVNRRGSHKSHIDQSHLNANVDNPIPEAIQLFDLNIGDTRLVKIANDLRHNHVVQTINLSHNAFGPDGIWALATALRANDNVVERLTLCGNPNMGLAGITALLHAVPHCSQLRALNLSQNQIGNAACHALAYALAQPSTQLQEVLLHGNRIGDPGAVVLATAVAHNRTMTSLDLSDNLMGDEGIAALAEGLRSNTTLRHFYVGDNRFTMVGLTSLLQLLQVANATLIAIHAPLHQAPPSSERGLSSLRTLMDQMAFYLAMNQHGRGWMRSDQPKEALLPYMLQPLTMTVASSHVDNMALVYGLLRDLPHVWCHGC